MTTRIPAILFTYARPDNLRQTLACLRENKVPFMYVFSDGPRAPDNVAAVAQVRNLLRAIDWCEVVLCERDINLGLGRSILTGVTEVLSKHELAIIFEDDLVCVPGTYAYLCAALHHYRDNPKVMSVTGWTHPKVTPDVVNDLPYFDGRAECWVWGTWARAWKGMQDDAESLMRQCNAKGIDVYKYGADLVEMAQLEQKKSIWAVRFLYWHILNRGICMRPPHSMVEHIGFGSGANCNSTEFPWFANPPLQACPSIPVDWPEPVENTQCSSLHQLMFGACPVPQTMLSRIMSRIRRYVGPCVRFVRNRV